MVSNHISHTNRIGAVRYLNSKPLIENLEHLTPYSELILDYPSFLAEGLAQGDLDVALIPSVEFFGHPEYEIVSDACVASRGPVLSVKLYSRVPLGEIQSLALDEGSRTSAALVQVMLAERYGVLPTLKPFSINQTIASTKTDAILMIGDRAIHPPKESFCETWDLGEQWFQWTGLPFVFAMWVTRKNTELGNIPAALEQARNQGEAAIPEIAFREANAIGIRVKTAQQYLTKNLHFRLGTAEQSGLRLFSELAQKLELIPNDHGLKFRDQQCARPSHCR